MGMFTCKNPACDCVEDMQFVETRLDGTVYQCTACHERWVLDMPVEAVTVDQLLKTTSWRLLKQHDFPVTELTFEISITYPGFAPFDEGRDITYHTIIALRKSPKTPKIKTLPVSSFSDDYKIIKWLEKNYGSKFVQALLNHIFNNPTASLPSISAVDLFENTTVLLCNEIQVGTSLALAVRYDGYNPLNSTTNDTIQFEGTIVKDRIRGLYNVLDLPGFYTMNEGMQFFCWLKNAYGDHFMNSYWSMLLDR